MAPAIPRPAMRFGCRFCLGLSRFVVEARAARESYRVFGPSDLVSRGEANVLDGFAMVALAR